RLIEERVNKREVSSFSDKNIIEVNNISYQNILSDISFGIRKGEIFGILGLVGSGREELAKILYGIIIPTKGHIAIDGRKKLLKTPLNALNNSITYVPSDRRYQGLFIYLSSLLNVGIMSLRLFSNRLSLLNKKKLVVAFNEYKDKLKIKVSSYKQQVSFLSGGNQQKILIARCLTRNSDIIILNEPTRGIDVGTKFEIHNLLVDISNSGKTIIVFSTEVPEVVNICDRILVLKKGKLGRIVNSDEMDQGEILNFLLN
ncbi:MAG: ATP-binding cassette domain-containing protein, partial [Actinobacteria bacterium]|nr:ATP-binding cassette domain-containing protein [Actinomycetota bacterium]